VSGQIRCEWAEENDSAHVMTGEFVAIAPAT